MPAETQLWQLVGEIEAIASEVSDAALTAAARRLELLVARDDPADNAIQVVPVMALTFAAPMDGEAQGEECSECSESDSADGGRSDADSAGSLPSGHAAVDDDDEDEAGRAADGGFFDDRQVWPGGPLEAEVRIQFAVHATVPADAYDAVDNDDDDDVGGGASRDTRLGRWHGRDSIGLAAHGREMYCDYCDLNGGVAIACMAADMLQQSRVASVIEKHRCRRQANRRADPDGSQARHACYKAIVAWQWANPLGAEQRVRLPNCVMRRVRLLFPNPVCKCAVVAGAECIALGHYTGFRTAAESRRLREAAFADPEHIGGR